ncbi:DNA recombination protein RmuC, partial [Silanimonas algicola]
MLDLNQRPRDYEGGWRFEHWRGFPVHSFRHQYPRTTALAKTFCGNALRRGELAKSRTPRNAKAQGNWGELVLERVLEASGLRKGQEYQVQDSQVREDGSRAQPDVVILLPEERRL